MKWSSAQPLTHPSARPLVAALVASLKADKLLKHEPLLVFVCGGTLPPSGTKAHSLRSQFVEWSKTNLNSVHLLLAEHAFDRAKFDDPYTFINTSNFEHTLATLADCILIFPESVGSYAELGLFSDNATINTKIMIANDRSYQSADSFINLGPIAKIDNNSVFKTTIHHNSIVTLDPHLFPDIALRLDNRFGKYAEISIGRDKKRWIKSRIYKGRFQLRSAKNFE